MARIKFDYTSHDIYRDNRDNSTDAFNSFLNVSFTRFNSVKGSIVLILFSFKAPFGHQLIS